MMDILTNIILISRCKSFCVLLKESICGLSPICVSRIYAMQFDSVNPNDINQASGEGLGGYLCRWNVQFHGNPNPFQIVSLQNVETNKYLRMINRTSVDVEGKAKESGTRFRVHPVSDHYGYSLVLSGLDFHLRFLSFQRNGRVDAVGMLLYFRILRQRTYVGENIISDGFQFPFLLFSAWGNRNDNCYPEAQSVYTVPSIDQLNNRKIVSKINRKHPKKLMMKRSNQSRG